MTVQEASQIRGANYIPARAASAYEMWKNYDRATIERDLSYAAKLKLSALRVFLSYDYWLEDRGRLENALYHLAQSGWSHKIRILPVLFNCRDKRTSFDDPSKWFAVEDFVNWFMQRWAHEHRMLALEVINEPDSVVEFKFARAMFARAARLRKSLPLTFGAKRLEDSRLLQDLGLDLLQVHENFHASESGFRAALDRAAQTQEILNRPVLVTEWQRIRGKPERDVEPMYATMAVALRDYPLGNFVWSLMLRRESDGALSGVFHQNGAVWSLDDARAISADPNFSAEQRQIALD